MIPYILYSILNGFTYPILLKLFMANLRFSPPLNTLLFLIFNIIYFAYAIAIMMIMYQKFNQYYVFPIIFICIFCLIFYSDYFLPV
jgi:hypothetical protein